MSKWRIHTPEGFQDILFDECAAKRGLEQRLRGLFVSCGYFEVETPTVEFFDVFSSDSGLIPQETMFKFFDQQGRILVIRPDITIPVARITATKHRDIPYPLRCSYIGNVFRYNEYGGGKMNEFTQAGVELLGMSTPESEAEVIAIAIKALREAGLESFQIDVGQVEFFNGLMEETGLPDEDIARMRLLIDHKDFVGVRELLARHDIREDLKKLILELPALFGSTEVIDKVEARTENKRCQDALDNIRKVIGILADYGLEKYVSVDLGMLRDLDYDTGIIFRGFTHGVGFPILNGGRYDRLVGEFGKDCPAVGFSLGVGLILAALQRQKAEMPKPVSDVIISYREAGRKTAFKLCDELRRQGLVAELDVSGTSGTSEAGEHSGTSEAGEHSGTSGTSEAGEHSGTGEASEHGENGGTSDKIPAKLRQYAADKGIGGIINVIGEEDLELFNLESNETSKTTFEELMKK